jgi:hypothetical protein
VDADYIEAGSSITTLAVLTYAESAPLKVITGGVKVVPPTTKGVSTVIFYSVVPSVGTKAKVTATTPGPALTLESPSFKNFAYSLA